MTIKECIDIVDSIKPNQYTIKDKVMWLSFIDEIIINEVLKTHEGYDGRYDSFEGYTEDKISAKLIVPSPYDRLYTAYLKMQIDKENGETARYNNSMMLYNTYMQEYRKHYNKTHMPLDTTAKRISVNSSIKPTQGLSEAEYENLVKDLTFILTEHFSDAVSQDRIYSIVASYIQNNSEMLKGKDGYTPQKGVDYWTEVEKQEMYAYVSKEAKAYTDEQIKKIDVSSAVEGAKAYTDEMTKCLSNETKVNAEYMTVGENQGIRQIKITLKENTDENDYVRLYLYKGDHTYTYIDTSLTLAGESIIINDTSEGYSTFVEWMKSGEVIQITTHGRMKEFYICDIEVNYYTNPSKAIQNVDDKIGDIDTVLDRILEIQNELLEVSE